MEAHGREVLLNSRV
jgi:hypothetical protein